MRFEEEGGGRAAPFLLKEPPSPSANILRPQSLDSAEGEGRVGVRKDRYGEA